MTSYEIDTSGLAQLLTLLTDEGWTLVGPRLRNGAVVYSPIGGIEDLPLGHADEQSPGRYRLKSSRVPGYFGFTAPAQSLKPLFHPTDEKLYEIRRNKHEVSIDDCSSTAPRLAIIGARACDLEGLSRLDQVMMHGSHPDPRYAARRARTLIVAVHCTASADTCFCASMKTGPRAKHHDLALTEVAGADGIRFALEVGSDAGADIVSRLNKRTASDEFSRRARELVQRAGQAQKRKVDPERTRALLARHLDHPNWQQIAERCLACANCTASCPTCFCSSVEERGGVDVDRSERWRRTDSCFNNDFSYIHGGSVRTSIASRYRQWLTHKFSHWYDQFGTSGCVGCGRCITWCPVGIDVTEEIARFETHQDLENLTGSSPAQDDTMSESTTSKSTNDNATDATGASGT